MKRFAVLLMIATMAVSGFAQVRVVQVTHEVDTLIYTSSKGLSSESVVDLFKGPSGYLFKVESNNIFDPSLSFGLGKTKEEAVAGLKELLLLCENDVDTRAVLLDSEGREYHVRTAYMLNRTRKPVSVKSDRLHLKHILMAGYMSINKKTIEDIINYLNGK
jgi:hypothetical protein